MRSASQLLRNRCGSAEFFDPTPIRFFVPLNRNVLSYHSNDNKNNFLNKIEMSPAYKKHSFVYWKVSDIISDFDSMTSPAMFGWGT